MDADASVERVWLSVVLRCDSKMQSARIRGEGGASQHVPFFCQRLKRRTFDATSGVQKTVDQLWK